MNRAFLIARQEFIKYVTRRGFALSILMFPLWIMIVILVPQWTSGSETPVLYTIVDRTGGFYKTAILEAGARENETRSLAGLSHYAQSYTDPAALARTPVAHMLAEPGTLKARQDFRRFGGSEGVLSLIRPILKPNAPPYRDRPIRFFYADPPRQIANASDADLPVLLNDYFAHDSKDAAPAEIAAAIVIPRDFGPDHPDGAQFWSSAPRGNLQSFLTDALTEGLRLKVLRRFAPDIDDTATLVPVAGVETLSPSEAGGRNASIDQLIPIALAILLFVVSVMNSSVLLQGVVEEKSTRMIEVLLSCATAREITTGKLIGVIAVALTTLLIWGLVLLVLAAFASQETVSLVFASLKTIATMETIPLLLIYFLCGLLIYGALFLAIGSMANSLADAQALLGPSMLILMLPNLMIAGVTQDPNGTLATVLSWVPIYTPFFMMLRISAHPPLWQLWGTAVLAIATTVLMIMWSGRVFAKHVLTTERPPALGKLIKGLFGRA